MRAVGRYLRDKWVYAINHKCIDSPAQPNLVGYQQTIDTTQRCKFEVENGVGRRAREREAMVRVFGLLELN